MKRTELIKRIAELTAILLGLQKRKSLYDIALASLGIDASPADLAPDELGCAETVSTLLARVLPQFPIVTGTWSLLDVLRRYPGIKEVTPLWPEVGDIVLYATGQGSGIFPGHVGIVG